MLREDTKGKVVMGTEGRKERKQNGSEEKGKEQEKSTQITYIYTNTVSK